MAKHRKKNVSGDTALRGFYESYGLAPNVIEGALKIRCQEPTKTASRETDIAKRLRGERIPPKVPRAK